ncbi:MAG: CvpA family protein [Enterocloster sp.]
MNMMTEHWLSVGACAFLIGMMLYGHYRGFLRQCISVAALALTIIVVKFATPYMTEYISENPAVREYAAQIILETAGWEAPGPKEEKLPAAQRMSIEQMKLPQTIKDILLENNNSEIYELLGVERFAEYVSTYLADMLIHGVVSALMFLACFAVVHLVIRWLNIISRLPILYGLNQIAGALLGLAYGLLLLWVAAFVLGLFAATPTGQMLETQIYSSKWLTFLYRYNLIRILLGGIVKGIF